MKDDDNICVVRLKTECWSTSRGVFTSKKLNYLKRKCVGCNILQDESLNTGPEDVINRIINLMSVPDGVYVFEACNIFRDCETGCIDDCDYRLVPLDQPEIPGFEGTREALDKLK